MSLKIRDQDLSPAEKSFLKWQYGFEEDDDPFEISLWQSIMRAWESDNAPSISQTPGTDHLSRLGAKNAYPEHVALYIKFKSDQSDRFWRQLISGHVQQKLLMCKYIAAQLHKAFLSLWRHIEAFPSEDIFQFTNVLFQEWHVLLQLLTVLGELVQRTGGDFHELQVKTLAR